MMHKAITLDVPIAHRWLMLKVRSNCEAMTREALKAWARKSQAAGKITQSGGRHERRHSNPIFLPRRGRLTHGIDACTLIGRKS